MAQISVQKAFKKIKITKKQIKKNAVIRTHNLLKLAEWEFEHLQDYSKEMEDKIEEEAGKLKKWIFDKIKDLSEEEGTDFFNNHSYRYEQLADNYPQILRQSLFVSCFSLLESNLSKLCSHLKEIKHLNLSLADISGDALSKFKTYIEKVALIQLQDDVNWGEIRNCEKIRHAIVHQAGMIQITPTQNAISNYLKSKKAFEFTEWEKQKIREKKTFDKQIILSKELCLNFTKHSKALICKLRELIGKEFNRHA